MRPKLRDPDLPRCVFFRHGAYYYVKGGKWHYLSKWKDEALAKAAEFQPLPIEPVELLRAHLLKKFTVMKARPDTRTGRLKAVTIDAKYVLDLAEASNWTCAVTGMPFSLESIKGRRPYAPSVDRIDNDKDYVPGNIRIVCTAANLAMNVWGEEVLLRMTRGIVARRRRVLDNPSKSKLDGEAETA